MKRNLDRILTVLVLAVFVTAAWSMIGQTPWAAGREFLGAGPGYDHWWQPVGDLIPALIVGWAVRRGVDAGHHRFSRAPVARSRRNPTSSTLGLGVSGS